MVRSIRLMIVIYSSKCELDVWKISSTPWLLMAYDDIDEYSTHISVIIARCTVRLERSPINSKGSLDFLSGKVGIFSVSAELMQQICSIMINL